MTIHLIKVDGALATGKTSLLNLLSEELVKRGKRTEMFKPEFDDANMGILQFFYLCPNLFSLN